MRKLKPYLRTVLALMGDLILLLSLTACSVDSNSTRDVTIHFWGQACFSIMAEGGIGVVTDPFPSPTVEPQVVTVSHEHPDHNKVENVLGSPEVIRGVGEHQAAGIIFTGVETFHDEVGGSKRGKNTVFVWDMEGLRFAHLGDLGHALTDEQVQQIGAVDVLMIPVAGGPTINGAVAAQVCEQLSAKLIIPMHYEMFGGPDGFLEAVPGEWIVEQPGTPSITVTAADFGTQETKIVILEP